MRLTVKQAAATDRHQSDRCSVRPSVSDQPVISFHKEADVYSLPPSCTPSVTFCHPDLTSNLKVPQRSMSGNLGECGADHIKEHSKRVDKFYARIQQFSFKIVNRPRTIWRHYLASVRQIRRLLPRFDHFLAFSLS